jgi:hypothetical protein
MRWWSPHGFLEEVQLDEQTARQWQREGILPLATTREGDLPGCYNEVHRTLVLAARELQRQGMKQLSDIAKKLDAMSPQELRALAGEPPEADGPPEPNDTVRSSVATLASARAKAPSGSQVAARRFPSSGSQVAAKSPSGSHAAAPTPAEVATYAEIALTPALSLRARLPLDEESRLIVRSIAALRGISIEPPF